MVVKKFKRAESGLNWTNLNDIPSLEDLLAVQERSAPQRERDDPVRDGSGEWGGQTRAAGIDPATVATGLGLVVAALTSAAAAFKAGSELIKVFRNEASETGQKRQSIDTFIKLIKEGDLKKVARELEAAALKVTPSIMIAALEVLKEERNQQRSEQIGIVITWLLSQNLTPDRHGLTTHDLTGYFEDLKGNRQESVVEVRKAIRATLKVMDSALQAGPDPDTPEAKRQ